jgi:hypothetical protein
LARDEVEVHQQVTAQTARDQSANEHSPA